jgi:hypothetical protein
MFKPCGLATIYISTTLGLAENGIEQSIYLFAQTTEHLELNKFTQTTDAATDGGRGSSSTGQSPTIRLTPSARHLRPQPFHSHGTPKYQPTCASRCPTLSVILADAYASTERAGVLAVLGDFNLLDLLTQGGTVAGAVLADYTNFLCVLGLGWMDERGRGVVPFGTKTRGASGTLDQ